MLAFHYSRAEHLEKAEEALIKAGEEALKSSASSEALHYYMEALRLYRQQSSETADPAKVARLEKNIALALYNRGQYEEAIEYFDKSLEYYWGKAPRHPVSGVLHITHSFFQLLVALYLPFTKFKKTPTARECEAIDLYYKKCQALVVIYPRRFFIESFYFYRRFTKFDYTHFQTGPGMFISASCDVHIHRSILRVGAPNSGCRAGKIGRGRC
jgi:tetratricopeptide (TPR) repeat protein